MIWCSLFVSVLAVVHGAQLVDPSSAKWDGCSHVSGEYSTRRQNGFVPGLYVVTSNIPGAMRNRDGSLADRKIVCAHEDYRTSGGSVVIPWAQFDKRDGNGGGFFDWDFVDSQMKPWVNRGQVVNLLVWPAVQKKEQLFPNSGSATPDYIMGDLNMTYQCPDGTAQGGNSEGIPLPMFWKPDVYEKYAQALQQFVRHYEDHPNVNVFRFGIGVGAESYPGNGATTPTNYCMNTFVNQFEGATYEEKAMNAYNTWSEYAAGRVRAFRRFSSKKPIVVTINDFYTLSSIPTVKFPNMVATEATKDYVVNGVQFPRLGLGVQGATTGDVEKYDKGGICYSNWCSIFEQARDLGIPLQLQTPLHSGVNGRPGPWQSLAACQQERKNNGVYGCTNTGNMFDLIEFSLSLGVNMFELYPYEWMVANDKSWSNDPPELNWYETYSQQYGKALYLGSNEQLVPISDEVIVPTQLPVSNEALVPTQSPESGEDFIPTQSPVSNEPLVPTRPPVSDEDVVPTQSPVSNEEVVPTRPPVSYAEDGLLSSSSHTINITLTTLVSLVLCSVLTM